jgi:hypothetical protein
MKSKFIINELWVLSVAGALQRANIYKPNITENAKKEFKKDLKNYLEQLVSDQYFKEVDENTHVANIHALLAYTTKFSSLLKNGKINFGVSQKILNLFLKYIWCLKLIPTPPHFPVDRIVQIEFNKKATANGIQSMKIKSWTQFKDDSDYLEIIKFAKTLQIKDKNYSNMSLAEMELALFNTK